MVAKSRHPIYKRWKSMKHRCKDPKKAKWYRDKGITVCQEWLEYDNFYKWCIDNGFKKNLDLDRIDDTKGYCPNNCQFISHADNIRKIKRRIKLK